MDRVGRPRTYTLSLLASAAGTAALGLAFSALLAAASYIARVLLFNVSLPTSTVIQQASVSPRWRSLMSGTVTMATTIAQAITAFGGGYLIATLGYRPLFLVSAAVVAVAAVLFWAWFGRARGTAAELAPAAVG
jgi:predicted MFS family arabinose efflux permease